MQSHKQYHIGNSILEQNHFLRSYARNPEILIKKNELQARGLQSHCKLAATLYRPGVSILWVYGDLDRTKICLWGSVILVIEIILVIVTVIFCLIISVII